MGIDESGKMHIDNVNSLAVNLLISGIIILMGLVFTFFGDAIFGAFTLAVGAIVIFLVARKKRPVLVIDKLNRKLEVCQTSLFEQEREQIPLAGLVKLRFRFLSRVRRPSFYLEFVFDDRPVLSYKNVVKSSSHAKQIADFLKVPFEKEPI